MSRTDPGMQPEDYLSRVDIHLDAIRWNYLLLRRHVGESVDLFPVIKADAYGHGAIPVAKILQTEGARTFGVARVEEAIALRNAGISARILVFCPPLAPQALLAATHRLECVACDPQHLEAIAAACQQTGQPIAVHLKTDIGMGRIGARPQDMPSLIDACLTRNIPIRGIMSHLPSADSADRGASEEMIKDFSEFREAILAKYPSLDVDFHLANSAATMRYSSARFNAVRAGIALYGQFPSVDMERELDLRPAMTLKTRIVFIKDVPPDTPISYSQTYRTTRPSRLATLPLGYADGFPRHASGKSHFLIHGAPAPQIGRVCMDQVIVDITDIPSAKIGDEAVAFGCCDNQLLRAEDVAARFDTIGYELTTRIGRRLPRFYSDGDANASISNS